MKPEEIRIIIDGLQSIDKYSEYTSLSYLQFDIIDKAADAIEQLQIESEHWKQAYYEERAKYLNLINNK